MRQGCGGAGPDSVYMYIFDILFIMDFFALFFIFKYHIKIYYLSKSCLRGEYLTLGLAWLGDSLGNPDLPHLPFFSPATKRAEKPTIYISHCAGEALRLDNRAQQRGTSYSQLGNLLSSEKRNTSVLIPKPFPSRYDCLT